MAKLLDASDRRPVGRSRARIVQDNSGVILAQGVREVVERREERQDKFAYAQAKAALLNADMEARRSLENDEDWRTYEERYREAMAAGLEEANALIRDEQDRAMFDTESQISIERGVDSVRNESRRREVLWGRSELENGLEQNRNRALEATDEPTRAAIVDNTMDLIAAAKEKQYVDDVTAESKRRAWVEDYAQGYVEVQSPDRRVELLSNPEGTPADLLAPDVRARMLEQAKLQQESLRVRAESQVQADGLVGEFDSEADALREARKIEDVAVRDATVRRVKTRFDELKAQEIQTASDRFDRASNVVEQNGLVSDIPADVWAEMSINERQALELRSRQVAAGVEPVHNDGYYYRWTLLEPAEMAKENVMRWRPYVDNTHFDRMISQQVAARKALEGDVDAAAQVTSSRSDAQRISQALVSSELFVEKPTKTSSTELKRRWASIESSIMNEIEETSILQGRKLTPTEKQEIIDRRVIESVFTERGIFGGAQAERLTIELTDEERQNAFVPIAEIPPETKRAIRNMAQSLGVAADDKAVEKAAAQILISGGGLTDAQEAAIIKRSLQER